MSELRTETNKIIYGAKGLIALQRSNVYFPSRQDAINHIRVLSDEVVFLQKRLNQVDPGRQRRQFKEMFL